MARIDRAKLARQVAELRAAVDDVQARQESGRLTGIAFVDAELARIPEHDWYEQDTREALIDARASYEIGAPIDFLTERLHEWEHAAAFRQPEPAVSLPPGWEHLAEGLAATLRQIVRQIHEGPHVDDWRPAPPSGNESPEWLAQMAELHDRIRWGLPLASEPLSPWQPALPAEDVAALITEAEQAADDADRRAEAERREATAQTWAYRSTRRLDGYPQR